MFFHNRLIRNILSFSIVFLFIITSLCWVPYHEHWADEVQAFLIARDADWIEILTKTPYREGQPILWHLLLKACIVIFGEDVEISYVSIAIMSLAVGLIVFKFDIPLFYQILIPFGYYFLYQYNIVARNYCLAYLALTLVGLFYKKRHDKIWAYTLSLAFLTETTSFYFPVAITLGCFYLYEIYTDHRDHYKRYILPLAFLICIGLSVLWQILPINHFSYYSRSHNHLTFLFLLKSVFLSYNQLGAFLFLIILSVYIWKFFYSYKNISSFSFNRNILYFLILMAIFIISVAVIRPYSHHQGLFFGLLLFSLYAFFQIKINYLIATLLLLHISWSVFSFIYDYNLMTSQQQAVIRFLKEKNLNHHTIFPIGYQTLPFQILYPRDKLFIPSEVPLYYTHEPSEYHIRHNFKQLLSTREQIMLIDPVSVAGIAHCQQIEDIKDSKKYFLFIFHGALVNKGEQGYLQTLYLFINRDTYLNQQNI